MTNAEKRAKKQRKIDKEQQKLNDAYEQSVRDLKKNKMAKIKSTIMFVVIVILVLVVIVKSF